MQLQDLEEDVSNLLYKFLPDNRLGLFILAHNPLPHQCFTLTLIFNHFYQILTKYNCFEETNPDVVVLPDVLANILNCPAFHIIQIRHILLENIVRIHPSLQPLEDRLPLETIDIPITSSILKKSTSLKKSPNIYLRNVNNDSTSIYSNEQNFILDYEFENLFRLSPGFCPNRIYYSLSEIVDLFTMYIQNPEKNLVEANDPYANVYFASRDTKLFHVIGISVFTKNQIVNIVQKQLIFCNRDW
jgi:hypothetical protein